MNISSYFLYNNHIEYKFKNQSQSIGIEPIKKYPIDMQNFICINHNCTKISIPDTEPTSMPSSIEYANIISRPDIYQPSYRIANFRNTTTTKNSRQGLSKVNNSINLTNSQKRAAISIGTKIIHNQTF